MGNFSVFKAAFAGFGLLGRTPLSVLVWYLVLVGYYVGYTALGTYMAGEAYAIMAELDARRAEDPTSFNMTTYMEVAGETSLHGVLGYLLQVAVNVVLGAAVLRTMLRPGKTGLAYMRVGSDELKLLIVTIVAFIIIALATLVPILIGVIGAAVSALAGGRGPLAIGIGGVGVILALCVFVFMSVQFLVAGAQTIAERKLRIFESWSFAKGRRWKMVATFLLAWLIMLPIMAASMGGAAWIAVQVGEVSTWREALSFVSYPPETPAELFTPARLAFYALIGLFLLSTMLIFLGMQASIFKQVTAFEDSASFAEEDDEDWDDED